MQLSSKHRLRISLPALEVLLIPLLLSTRMQCWADQRHASCLDATVCLCTAFVHNTCALCQVDGKVTGSFQSGYLAEVAVNGFTYHAVLFSPYLALNTPDGMYSQVLSSPKVPGQHITDGPGSLPIMPEDSGVLDPTALDSKAEDDAAQVLNPPSPPDFVEVDHVQPAVPE